MAKQRYVNTHFWNDSFIEELKPLERYLFMYFLTNPHTSICGVYELSIKKMRMETGLAESRIKSSLDRFTLAGKVFYLDGWVYLKNFIRHQAVNPNVEKGIRSALDCLPEKISKKVKEIESGSIAFESLLEPLIGTELSEPESKLKLLRKGADAEWNSQFFKGLKDAGITIQDAAGERIKYPRLFRKKNPDPHYWIAVARFSQEYNFRAKGGSDYTFPWKGPIKLSKLYYEAREKYDEQRSGVEGAKKLQDMKAGIFKSMQKA